MKYFTVLLLFLSTALYAQPENDNCSGIVDLGNVPNCSSDNNFSNNNATLSNNGFDDTPGSCTPDGETPFQRDVWFQFNTTNTIIDVSIILKGITTNNNPITNPHIGIYRGECAVNSLAWLDCTVSDSTSNATTLNIQGLTPNTTYIIRVSDVGYEGVDYSGDFNLCVQEFTPTFTITDGFSNSCVGTLYDDGGPDGNYSDAQNSTFTICPQDLHSCINFNMVYFNIESSESGGLDNFIIYDGQDVNAPILADLTGSGYNYDAGGGGVCLSVRGTSGCITVNMISDGAINFEGFEANWSCSFSDCEPTVPLAIESEFDFTELEAILSTPASLVKVVSLECHEGGTGTFSNGDNTDLGIAKGIVLSTGLATNASGPNTLADLSGEFERPGDMDLDILSELFGDSSLSEDACILELDITANTDQIQFEYIFGSEEYIEFVGSQFNDIFAFLVSGDGIIGTPELNNQKNIAVIPETGDPIQINSVNNLTNWEYYRQNNIIGQIQSTEYDGLTSNKFGGKKSITAFADVTPCQTYRLKLAIGDRGDDQFDSGVFISEISGGTPDMEIVFASGLDYFIEDCSGTSDLLQLVLTEALDSAFSIDISISGTAELGIDYTLDVPGTVTFQPGETELTFPIVPLGDNIMEEAETIIITFTADFGCGPIEFKTLEVVLRDDAEVEIELTGDTLLTCENQEIPISVTGAIDYSWTPSDLFDDPTSANPNVSPVTSGWFFVTGTVGTCMDSDSIYIKVVDPTFKVLPEVDQTICFGDRLQLSVGSNFPIDAIEWTPGFNLDDPTSLTPTFMANFAFEFEYTATATIANCTFTDDLSINVEPIDIPILIARDTTICAGETFQLASGLFFPNSDFDWTPGTFLNDSTIYNPITAPEETIQYILTTTGETGVCVRMDTIDITVNEITSELNNPDSIYLCLGDSVQLFAEFGPDVASFEWIPAIGLNDPASLMPFAKPTETTIYYFKVSTPECDRLDSIWIKVDSIPIGIDTLIVTPPSDPYCAGDIISIFSPMYDIVQFPDITHQWLPNDGTIQTDSTELNIGIELQDTTEYFRITMNNACRDTSSVIVNVIPTQTPISVTDTTLCPGEEFMVMLLDAAVTDIEWTPEELVSCTACPNPTVSVIGQPGTTLQIMVSGMNRDCPVGASLTVTIPPIESLDFDDIYFCPGEMDTIIDLSNLGFSNFAWMVNGDASLSCNDCPNPSISPMAASVITFTADNINPEFCGVSGVITFLPGANEGITSVNLEICENETLTLDPMDPTLSDIKWTIVEGDGNLSCTDCGVTEITGGTVTTIIDFTAMNSKNEFCTASGRFVLVPGPNENLQNIQINNRCPGEIFTLDPLNPNLAEIQWTVLDNGDATLSCNQCPTTDVTLGENAVVIEYLAVNANSEFCTARGTFIIGIANEQILPDLFETICPNEDADLNFSSLNLSNVQLSISSGISSCSDCLTPTVNISENATLEIVGALEGTTCRALSNVFISVFETNDSLRLECDPTQDGDTVFLGRVVQVTAVTPPTAVVGVWTVNDEIQMDMTGPVLEFRVVALESNVTFSYLDQNGCTISASKIIIAKPDDANFPNAFTPYNNDGLNDFFRPIELGENTLESLKVWNRWGQLVYDSNDPEGWDGLWKGKQIAADVYVWTAIIRRPDGESFGDKGDVTLMR